jgi:prepilin-type N-terminal cleavage/methylation domain-containing protein
MKRTQGDSHRQRGFTLIEVVMATFILTVGLVSFAGLFGASIGTMFFAQENLISKQIARETMESIFTARNTQQITFDQIRNVLSGGIFQDGFQPPRLPGADGLAGTADDGAISTMVQPGPDGTLYTADDEVRSLASFQRQVLIQPIIRLDGTTHPDLRQVTVSVRYLNARGQPITYQIASYVSRFR